MAQPMPPQMAAAGEIGHGHVAARVEANPDVPRRVEFQPGADADRESHLGVSWNGVTRHPEQTGQERPDPPVREVPDAADQDLVDFDSHGAWRIEDAGADLEIGGLAAEDTFHLEAINQAAEHHVDDDPDAWPPVIVDDGAAVDLPDAGADAVAAERRDLHSLRVSRSREETDSRRHGHRQRPRAGRRR